MGMVERGSKKDLREAMGASVTGAKEGKGEKSVVEAMCVFPLSLSSRSRRRGKD